MHKMEKSSIVWCKMPKAGLGNQLFPLMKALVFANLNNLPLVVTHYHQLKIGPYLRGEKTKRNYQNYFSFQKGIFGERMDRLKVRPGNYHRFVEEPELKQISSKATLYCFQQIPHWKDYFGGLKKHRELVIELFYKILTPKIKERLNYLPSPEIGIHIRMGDFRKLLENEAFSQAGAVRTPQSFFVDTIQLLRSFSASPNKVSIFTDGRANEMKEILSLTDTTIVEGNADIVDLLQLSRSKVIVASAGSTFSYWAGFLSDSPVLFHPDHPYNIRLEKTYFEGTPQAYKQRVNG